MGLSTNKFAKMVGIAQNSMRMILMGANRPTPRTAQKIEEVLASVHACPTCGRAFLEELPGGNDFSKDSKAKEVEKKT